MSLTPLVFTGISTFSSDFQTVLDRAVSIAKLPIKGLQNDQETILSKKAALGGFSSSVASLAASLDRLGTVATGKALGATTSNYSLAGGSVTGDAQPGVYTIGNISSLASTATSMSASFADVTEDAVTGTSNYLQLAVGTTVADIQLTDDTNNLNGLRDAINDSGLGVTATIIQTGTTTPEYRLSISANGTGENAIQLRTTADQSGTNILPTVNAGSNAVFEIGGQAVLRKTNSITDVIPGVTLTLNGKTSGTETVQITVSSGRDTLKDALADFVDQYNSVVDAIDSNTGKDAGILSGEASIREIRRELSQLLATMGDGSIGTLGDLGISLDNDGKLTLDETAIDLLSTNQLADAFEFIGSTDDTGLASFAGRLAAYSDTDGIFESQQDDLTETNDALADQIEKITERVQTMQLTLQAKLQAADVLLAQLERQQGLLTASIDSLNLTLFGKKDS